MSIKTNKMGELQTLLKQTENAFEWTNKLIGSIPTEKWDTIAEGVESSISWQVGHQIISVYYHTIMTTVGHIPELIENLNLRLYTEICNYNTFAKDMVGRAEPKQLMEHLKIMQEQSLTVIGSLSENDLQKTVEPTKVPHPVAKIKFEAIDWNIKHTMWHCGQIATIKRIVDNSYDYGIKRPKERES
tara:strand:- start:21 stop:581 length:561 start_codon:yes stop_codon:yes gene_type:complete